MEPYIDKYNLYHSNKYDNYTIDKSKIDIYYGVHLYIKKEYELMKKYYLMAIKKNHCESMYILGLYYEEIEKDYNLMKKYYLMAIEKDSHLGAMNNLGLYYEEIEKDYNLMKKYYQMAIKKGNDRAMYNLGSYYEHNEKNYDLMKTYYLMAIKKGNSRAMYNLGLHYKTVEKDYSAMKKYYLMAINKNNINAIYDLGRYYEKEKNYDRMEKYYLMAIDKMHAHSINRLEKYYRKNNDTIKLLTLYKKIGNQNKLCKVLIDYSNKLIENSETTQIFLESLKEADDKLLPISLRILKKMVNDRIDLLEMHFRYSMNGQGFNEAKKDFYQQLSFFDN